MLVFLECDNCMQSQVCKEVLSNSIFFTPVNYIHRQVNNVRMNKDILHKKMTVFL